MKRRAAVAMFALCAGLFLSADLGLARLRAQVAWHAPLQVYATGDISKPVIDDEVLKGWQAHLEVTAAVPVHDVPVTLAGAGWVVDAHLRAVPQSSLPQMNLELASGDWPNSAWGAQLLLGADTAHALATALRRAGAVFPRGAKLYIGGQGSCEVAGIAPVSVALSGVAADTQPGAIVWTDTALLHDFVLANAQYCQEMGITATAVRADIYLRPSADRAAFAQRLGDAGYLVRDPYAPWAAAVRAGQSMRVRWGVLAAVCAAICVVICAGAVQERHPLRRSLAVTSVAVAVGLALAVALMQTAMLLGWGFFTDAQARYLLTWPRALAIWAAGVCMVIGAPLLRQAVIHRHTTPAKEGSLPYRQHR